MKRIFTPIRIYYITRLYVKFICGHNRSPSRLMKHEYKSVGAYKRFAQSRLNVTNSLLMLSKRWPFLSMASSILEKSIPPSRSLPFLRIDCFRLIRRYSRWPLCKSSPSVHRLSSAQSIVKYIRWWIMPLGGNIF